jgi:hypothetical protein
MAVVTGVVSKSHVLYARGLLAESTECLGNPGVELGARDSCVQCEPETCGWLLI